MDKLHTNIFDSGTQPFIKHGRETQLLQLETALAKALAGKPQIAFVTGDAGIGKSALVQEFCRHANKIHRDLTIAWGQFSELNNAGEPYLPFKQILAQLIGDENKGFAQYKLPVDNNERLQKVCGQIGEAIVTLGPEVIGLYAPVTGVGLQGLSYLFEKFGGIEWLQKTTEYSAFRQGFKPEQFYEQFSRILLRGAEKAPLLLVLEDLHWSDEGSISLLFHLARQMQRVQDSHLLVLGTYRLAEVEIGRNGQPHPLSSAINNLHRYWGDISIDLTKTVGQNSGRQFINALLKSEPIDFDPSFAELLLKRTEGHPLFTIELLRDLEKRGLLARNHQGRWILTRPVSFDDLPQKIGAVFKEQFQRLRPELKNILNCACIEGEEFTAEVVVTVLAQNTLHLAQQLDEELDQQHRLIFYTGGITLPQQRLTLFRFYHTLFQHYIYETMRDMSKRQLHHSVGAALEQLYGDSAHQIAGKLAHHFDQGDDATQAIGYYKIAARQAQQSFANEDSLRLYNRGLELLAKGETDLVLHYELLAGKRQLLQLLSQRQEEWEVLNQLFAVAKQLAKDEWLVETKHWLARHYANYQEYDKAMEVIQHTVALARQLPTSTLLGQTLLTQGWIARMQSDLHLAQTLLQEALRFAQNSDLQELQADCLATLGQVHFDLGEHQTARSSLEQALSIHQQINTKQNQHRDLYLLSYVCTYSGDFTSAYTYAQQAIAIARKSGDRGGEAEGIVGLAICHLDLGDYSASIKYHEQARQIYREVEDQRGVASCLLSIGLAQRELGQLTAARQTLEEALQIGRAIDGKRTEAYALCYLGLVFESLDQLKLARAHYADAAQLRRQIGQHSFAMDAVAGLARCELARGDLISARQHVQTILDWLTTNQIEKMEYPLRVYHTCITVLQRNTEPDLAHTLLEQAYAKLMERANRIENQTWRRIFLEEVSYNHALVRLQQQKRAENETGSGHYVVA